MDTATEGSVPTNAPNLIAALAVGLVLGLVLSGVGALLGVSGFWTVVLIVVGVVLGVRGARHLPIWTR